MPRPTDSRVIGMWTRALLDELAPEWRATSPVLAGLVDPSRVRGADPYILHEDMLTLWARLTEDHADPCFGLHFAERHADRAVGLYAYAAAHAPDFGTAARACVQLQRLIDTDGAVTMTPVPDGLRIEHVPPRGVDRWPRHLAESLLGGCVHLGRTFTGVPLTPREIHVQHRADVAAASAWFGCQVRDRRPSNAMVFDKATLDLPFRHADATQFAALIAAAMRTLAAVAPPDPLLDDVRAVLRARQGTRRSIGDVARALGVADRTLQRRLAEAGTTFRKLLDEVRVETLAEHSVSRQKGLATAGAVGFADPSSLRRLRKRWRSGS